MALALARLRQTQGQPDQAHAFANHALSHAGSAVFIKAQAQAMLEQQNV